MTLKPGDEITIVTTLSYTGRVKRMRVVYRQDRTDGSIEVYDPRTGHLRIFSHSEVERQHRKHKLDGRRT